MRGHLERCWHFVYRMPEAEAHRLLPASLRPVTCRGSAFWHLVVCEVSALRPAGIPRALGMRYRHVAYRIHVRLGQREGLYFLRSDCDSGLVSALGNAVTDFRFHPASIAIQDEGIRGTAIRVTGRDPQAAAEVLVDESKRPELAWDSPFATVKEAADRLQYPPLGISIGARSDTGRRAGRQRATTVAIRRDERLWRQRPVSVPFAHWSFLDGRQAEPELAFRVSPIDYEWSRGRTEETNP